MSLMDFSNTEKEIKEAPAPRVLAKGEEAEIRIIGVKEGVSDKNGARWFSPRFDVPRDPMVKEFNSFFWNPLDNAKIDEKQKQMNNYSLQQFFAAFKVDLSKPFSFDDLVGKKAWGIAGVRHNDEHGDQNIVSKWVTGQGQGAGASAPVDPNY